MTQQTNPQPSEELYKTLATFLRIARKHKSDIEMLPVLEDLRRFVNQEVQKALSMVEVPEKISMKHAIKTHSASGAGHTIGFNTAVDQVTTSINKIKEQYKVKGSL